MRVAPRLPSGPSTPDDGDAQLGGSSFQIGDAVVLRVVVHDGRRDVEIGRRLAMHLRERSKSKLREGRCVVIDDASPGAGRRIQGIHGLNPRMLPPSALLPMDM